MDAHLFRHFLLCTCLGPIAVKSLLAAKNHGQQKPVVQPGVSFLIIHPDRKRLSNISA